MRFQITLTSNHAADFRWVPFSDLGDQTAKKRRKKEERKNPWQNISPPTYYVGRPNYFSDTEHVGKYSRAAISLCNNLISRVITAIYSTQRRTDMGSFTGGIYTCIKKPGLEFSYTVAEVGLACRAVTTVRQAVMAAVWSPQFLARVVKCQIQCQRNSVRPSHWCSTPKRRSISWNMTENYIKHTAMFLVIEAEFRSKEFRVDPGRTVNPLKPTFFKLLHVAIQVWPTVFNFWHSGTMTLSPACPNVRN